MGHHVAERGPTETCLAFCQQIQQPEKQTSPQKTGPYQSHKLLFEKIPSTPPQGRKSEEPRYGHEQRHVESIYCAEHHIVAERIVPSMQILHAVSPHHTEY